MTLSTALRKRATWAFGVPCPLACRGGSAVDARPTCYAGPPGDCRGRGLYAPASLVPGSSATTPLVPLDQQGHLCSTPSTSKSGPWTGRGARRAEQTRLATLGGLGHVLRPIVADSSASAVKATSSPIEPRLTGTDPASCAPPLPGRRRSSAPPSAGTPRGRGPASTPGRTPTPSAP